MNVLNKIHNFLMNKTRRKQYCVKISDKIFHYSDKVYISKLFYATFGFHLDWEHPKTFNEKLNWLKVYDRRPEYTMMVDKVAVKYYIENKCGGGGI